MRFVLIMAQFQGESKHIFKTGFPGHSKAPATHAPPALARALRKAPRALSIHGPLKEHGPGCGGMQAGTCGFDL